MTQQEKQREELKKLLQRMTPEQRESLREVMKGMVEQQQREGE